MSPGVRLAIAWLARALSWALLMGGGIALAGGLMLMRADVTTRPPADFVPLAAAGLAAIVVAWYANRWSAAERQRQAAAWREPRGFVVIAPGAEPGPDATEKNAGTGAGRQA